VQLFTDQATQVDTWDRELVEQRDRTLQLHETAERLDKGSKEQPARVELALSLILCLCLSLRAHNHRGSRD